MRTETRLKISTVFSLTGLIGLAVIFYIFLPDQADEVLRREGEVHLENVGKRFTEDVRSLSEPLANLLQQVKKDESVLALLGQDDGLTDLAADVDLAKKLCGKYGLTNLVIIDEAAVVRSAWPEAARVGLKDKRMLDLSRMAFTRPAFVDVSADNSDKSVLLSIAVSAALQNQELFLLGKVDVSRENIEDLAARKSTVLVEAARGEADLQADETDVKIVVVKNDQGARVASVVLKSTGDNGRIIRMLLIRNIVILAVPWVLLFMLIIIWLGWPAAKRKEK